MSDGSHLLHGPVPHIGGGHVGELEQLETAGAVARVEEGREVGAAVDGADRAADAVARREELVGRVRGDQAVGAGDEDERGEGEGAEAGGDEEVGGGHYGLVVGRGWVCCG